MTQALITAEPLTKLLVRRKKVHAAWSRPFGKYRGMARVALWLSQKPNLARSVSGAADLWSSRRVKFNSGGRPEQTHVR